MHLKTYLEMLHSFLLFQYPCPLVCGPLDSVGHTSKDDLRDLRELMSLALDFTVKSAYLETRFA